MQLLFLVFGGGVLCFVALFFVVRAAVASALRQSGFIAASYRADAELVCTACGKSYPPSHAHCPHCGGA